LKVTDFIIDTINKLPKGYVFTYEYFITKVSKKEAIIKALNRMVAAGKITKLAKGKYYKPENTVFGTLEPKQYQVVKDLLEEDGKIVGYLTGLSIYNQLGLSTQVSNTIQIGKNETRPKFKRDKYSIVVIRQKNNITKDNIPNLQLLDALRYIKKIPDTTLLDACVRFLALLKPLSPKELSRLIKLAMVYPPSTRALLGALLDEMGKNEESTVLLASLNPITTYNFKGVAKVLSQTEKWNIR